MNKRVWPFLYAHTHFLFSWLGSGDVVLSFFLLSLHFLAGTVCFQLFVHKVFKRVQVSFSFVLIGLQMENGGEPSAFGRLWSNKAGKSHTTAALITCRKTYLLAIVEKEQCGISPYTVLRAHLIMLSTVHLNRTKTCALKRKFTYVSVEWPNKGVRSLSRDQHPVLLSLNCFNVLVIEVPTFPILTSSVCSKVVASCSQVGAMALQWPHHGAKNLMKWDPGRGGKKKKATKNFSF